MSKLVFLFAALILVTSCKKEDTKEPAIVLNGDNPQEVELNSSYVELGANATDAEDGAIDSNQIQIDGTGINTSVLGKYKVLYSVTDAAGNLGTRTRKVHVRHFLRSYIGNYSVVTEDTLGNMNTHTASIDTLRDSTGLYYFIYNMEDLEPSQGLSFGISGDLGNQVVVGADSLDTVYIEGGLGMADSLNLNFQLNYVKSYNFIRTPLTGTFTKL